MLEALTSEQIIKKSKGWQSKLVAEYSPSLRDLLNLVTDVVRIRYSVGLTSVSGVAELSTRERYLYLAATLKGEVPSSATISTRLPEIENSQQVGEGFYLSEGQDPFTGRPLVSMIHSVAFCSPVTKTPIGIRGEKIYEDSKASYLDNLLRKKLAQVVWQSHLANDAPYKDAYCTDNLTSSVSSQPSVAQS